jgi:putative spermidine/putrescine transport system ATP-binding protein
MATVDVAGHALRGVACPGLAAGGPATLVVKCERVQLADGGTDPGNRVAARFEFAGYLGASVQLQCLLGEQRLVAMLPGVQGSTAPLAADAPVTLGWREADGLVFPREG